MIVKTFEVRDRNTFIPALAVQMTSTVTEEKRLLRRVGFGDHFKSILLVHLGNCKSQSDPFSWGDRTMQVAHGYIESNFNKMKSGDVVDVRHILGETGAPAESEFARGGL